MTVTVTNRSARRVSLMLRPATVAIDATNHFGVTFHCQWPRAMTPIIELFTTLPPKGRASTDVLVKDLCPAAFLSWPGLYSLRASVDTRAASGEAIGIHSFVGTATAPEPTLVRVRTRPPGAHP